MEMNEAVHQATLEALQQNEPACVLTIVEVSGSTPRGVGAKMLLRADGSSIGSIGGGALEAAALQDAREALDRGESRLEAYSVRGQDDGALGICGGDARVFIEVIHTRRTLLIAGAGHVAQPIAELGHMLGFRVVVVDDRAELASSTRFPDADELVVTSFQHLLDKVSVTSRTYVVIVTRGHEHDGVVLQQALSTPAAYIGMIGSRTKVKQVFETLLAGGTSEEALARVFAPVGLRIGGQTPAEIALSIMAEIALVEHDGTGEPMSLRDSPVRNIGQAEGSSKSRTPRHTGTIGAKD